MKYSKRVLFIFIIFSIIIAAEFNLPVVLSQETPAVISDGTFDEGDWSVFKVISNAGSGHTVQQALAGGNPGAFRSMTHILPPVPQGVLAEIMVVHLNIAENYDPVNSGAIDHIDYAEDGIMLTLPWQDAFSVTQLALVQDNRLFLSNNFISFIGNTSWQSQALQNLTANDFVADDGSGDRPDFSASGRVVQFGYARRNIRSETLPPVPSGRDLVYEHGLDNWTVAIFSEGASGSNIAPVAEDDLFVFQVGTGHVVSVLDNDTDADGDRLSISDFTLPQHGELREGGNKTLIYDSSRTNFGVDSFTYTVTDGELTDTGNVQILIDCSCFSSCFLYDRGQENAFRSESISNSQAVPPSHSRGASQTENIDLDLIYRVRDEVMKPTSHGKRYVDKYYKTNPEILKILLIDSPDLRAEAVATVEMWQDNLRDLVDGDGTAIVTQDQMDALGNFLAGLSAAASPELRQVIADELDRLGPLDDYAGLTTKEAKSKMIGDPAVYLPIVIKPE